MWEIDKTFEFCYGHRVHTQTLNGEFADSLKCACRHLHGHEGKLQVHLTGDDLNESGMVTDFRHLEWLKKFINEFNDHQFVIDINDPLFGRLVGVDLPLIDVVVPGTTHKVGSIVDVNGIPGLTGPEYECLEGFLIIDFVPTSEKLSQWMAGIVDAKMSQLGVKVSKIEWWETPKSRSTYFNKYSN